ncbi:MAG: imidazoleglycerol-phosphate dehydratase HisB [Acholeplasma sp.]|jgi:imidazoleglycerol-phosphate dehydratase|nr:MAG: imidazoleglycerol-phosphate dehydratase HisB [Acholeplasma sp.]
MRTQTINRTTKETSIQASINLDGTKQIQIETGIPFFDHMLTLFAFHGNFDLNLLAKGDVYVDDHHTVEDCGIVLGQAIDQALGEKKGIERYSSVYLPMDEALVRVVIDISNRPMLIFKGEFNRESIGGLSLENVREFLKAFTTEARITLHIEILDGLNDHHKVEAIFKGLGRALKLAVKQTSEDLPSTKGVL